MKSSTLIYLLVAFAVASGILALLSFVFLPAILQARNESARRSQCAEQLKNINAALKQYHKQNSAIPDNPKLSQNDTAGNNIKPTDSLPPAAEGKTWKLVWDDEFDGDKLDETKWQVPPEAKRRDGWWMRQAIALDGHGHLAMKTIKDGDKFIDGCVRTRGKFEHAFGYYVARVQLQKQPGHWSAFWLFNDCVNKVGNEGQDGTEIDIFEKPWLDDRVQQTLHWDGYGKEHKTEGNVAKIPGVMDGWHTFSLLWTPEEYVFYVDGKEMWRTKAGRVCQVPLYIKLSDEIGDWAGDIKKAQLPDAFLVDYVRVYDLVESK
jgi:beta-glucanase (GH16 family)